MGVLRDDCDHNNSSRASWKKLHDAIWSEYTHTHICIYICVCIYVCIREELIVTWMLQHEEHEPACHYHRRLCDPLFHHPQKCGNQEAEQTMSSLNSNSILILGWKVLGGLDVQHVDLQFAQKLTTLYKEVICNSLNHTSDMEMWVLVMNLQSWKAPSLERFERKETNKLQLMSQLLVSLSSFLA